MRRTILPLAAALALAGLSISCGKVANAGNRQITVAQSGAADVTGSDSAALQRAANMLRPGDTLSIGAGTYEMNDSLFIPSGVTVKGVAGQTILRKARGVESALSEDGDYGESMIAVAEPQKFRPGMGISIVDDQLNSGWDISVTSVTGVDGRFLRISPMTVRDYNLEKQHARVRTAIPILCVMDAENVTLDGVTVDGNRAENAYIDGCRGGAIYLYRVRNVTVRNCTARNYNGDGISFQITNGVRVLNCDSTGNAGFGLHPGTGSEAPLIQNCRMRQNGDIGLFLCWRVRHGRFLDNTIEENGKYGVSIGHKDTDNEFVNNTIARNGVSGVYFRPETMLNSGHRNTFRKNRVIDNGGPKAGYGFYIEPYAGDLLIEDNEIADTRTGGRTQRYGLYRVAGAGAVNERNNRMSGHVTVDVAEGAGLPLTASR